MPTITDSKPSPEFTPVSLASVYNKNGASFSEDELGDVRFVGKDLSLTGENVLRGIPFSLGKPEGDNILFVRDDAVTLNFDDPLRCRYLVFIHTARHKPVTPDEKHLNAMGLTDQDIAGVTFYSGEGCEECRYTGYSGRTALFEYLAIDSDIRNEISKKSDAERIKKVALGKGLATLRQNGWEKVKNGVTTLPEILRVTLEK